MADHSAASSTVLISNHFANSKIRNNNNWTNEEFISLCDVWKDYLNDLRAHKRNVTVYEKMSKRLQEVFIRRTSKDIRTKIQNLAQEYRKEKAKMTNGHAPSVWKFWNIVHSIIGNLPVNDYSKIQESVRYVLALEKKFVELKNINTCQPSIETLNEYEKKVKFLKGIVEAEKLPTASEKAMANQFLSPGLLSSPKHSRSKELHLQTKARYLQEMREELLDNKCNSYDSGDLRLRQKYQENKEIKDLDAVLRYHHSMQEKVAEEMVALAQNLKQNSLLAGHFIRKDTETLQKASHLTDQNYSRLKVETDRLEKHSKRCCNWWVWLVLGSVCITFLWMIVFMRLFPKR